MSNRHSSTFSAIGLLLVACFTPKLIAQTLAFNPGFVSAYEGDTTGTQSPSIPTYQGAKSGLFQHSVDGLAFDANGNLLIASSQDGVIRVIASGKSAIPYAPSAGSNPQAGTVFQVAGTGNGSVLGATCTAPLNMVGDGCAASAAVLAPLSVTVDSAGDIFFVDQLNNGELRVVYEGGVKIPGLQGSPVKGNVYQIAAAAFGAASADSHNNIYFPGQDINSGANLIEALYSGSGSLPGITDPVAGTIYTIAGDGGTCFISTTSTCGLGGSAANVQFGSYALGLQVDASGNIYVAAPGNSLIDVIYAAGTVPGLTNSSNATRPQAGNLYQFAGNGAIGQETAGVAATRSPLQGAPGQPYFPPSEGAGNGPVGPIAFDSAGSVYVAGVNSDIIRINPEGILQIVLLGGGIPNVNAANGANISACLQSTDGIGDGCPANQVLFDYGTGLAIDSQGNLYTSDTYFGATSNEGVIHRIDVGATTLFPTGPFGSPVPNQVIDLYNTSSEPLNVTAVTVSGFGYTSVPAGSKMDCSATDTLAAGADCEIAVQFVADATGSFPGSVAVASNSTSATSGENSITLTGTSTVSNTTTGLVASPVLPSVTNTGQNIALAATVAPPFGVTQTPTGTVTFTFTSNNVFTTTTVSGNLSKASNSLSAVTTAVDNSLPADSYSVQAAYSGDANFGTSVSPIYQVTVADPSQPAASILLAASSLTPTAGQSVTLTATVSAPSGGVAPTGTVVFEDGFVAGSNVIGSSKLNGSGVAMLSTSKLPLGLNNVVAYYSGDAGYTGNASAPLTVNVASGATLQLVPGVISTIAGQFGNAGYMGDNAAALSAALQAFAITSDPYGNIYLADDADNVVRVIASGRGVIAGVPKATQGQIYTVAGNGMAGPSGDTGPATSASLNAPAAVFVDAFGNLYIGDGYGQAARNTNAFSTIRRVDANTGNINTVAGTPSSGGYGGDGGPATNALISANGFFVDNEGNIYIADTANNLVRYVDAQTGTISTIAGNAQLLMAAAAGGSTVQSSTINYCLVQPCGDAGLGTQSTLSFPGAVAADAAGSVYIADTGDGVVRKIDAATGLISTVAGTFRTYSETHPASDGDGGPATSAVLSNPLWIELDAASNLYISDGSFSGLIREVNAHSQTIETIVGNGVACTTDGKCGDSGLATKAAINLQANFGLDAQGELYTSDNDTIRQITAATSAVAFGNVSLDASPTQLFSVTNSGTQPLILTQLAFTGDFAQRPSDGTDCAASSQLLSGASCNILVEYAPTQAITENGSLTITDNSNNATAGANLITLSGTGISLGGTAPNKISFAPISSVTYGQTVTLVATAQSGLPVSFLADGPAKITGNLLTATGAGVVSVKAYQVGGVSGLMNYAAAVPVIQQITVNPAPLAVTAGDQSVAQGSPLPDLSKDFVITGLLGADVTIGLPALTTTASNTRSCQNYLINIGIGTLVTPAGYAVTFNPGTLYITGTQPQTITFSQSFAGISYGSAPVALTANSSGSGNLPISYTVTGPATISGSTLTITGTGLVTITANQYGNCTYAAAVPKSHSFTVAPATLTVTADNLAVGKGVAIPPLTYSITGFVGQDTAAVVTGAPVLTTTATIDSAPGKYPIAVMPGSLSATNYIFNLLAGTLTVNPGVSQTVTFGAIAPSTYGAAPLTLAASSSSGLPIVYTVVSISGTQVAAVVNNTLTIAGAGTASIIANQPGGGIYGPASPVTQTFTVAPALLTITANDATRPNNTVNPQLTSSVTGFVYQDTLANVLGSAPVPTTTAVPNSPVGTYPIVVSATLNTPNYVATFIPGTLTVTAGGPVSDFTLTATPGSLSILVGQGQQSTIAITPTNYYQGTVNLSCGSLPANLTCVFSPPAISAVGSGPVTTTLTVNTSSAIVGTAYKPALTSFAAVFWFPAGLSSLFLVIGRRKSLRKLHANHFAGLLLIVAAAAFLSGCGSRTSSANNSPYAAPGTYSVEITAQDSNGGPTHSTALIIQVK